jgi:hypothetical protein
MNERLEENTINLRTYSSVKGRYLNPRHRKYTEGEQLNLLQRAVWNWNIVCVYFVDSSKNGLRRSAIGTVPYRPGADEFITSDSFSAQQVSLL